MTTPRTWQDPQRRGAYTYFGSFLSDEPDRNFHARGRLTITFDDNNIQFHATTITIIDLGETRTMRSLSFPVRGSFQGYCIAAPPNNYSAGFSRLSLTLSWSLDTVEVNFMDDFHLYLRGFVPADCYLMESADGIRLHTLSSRLGTADPSHTSRTPTC